MTENQFIQEYPVGDKVVKIDALLVLSELTMMGAEENPTRENLIQATRNAIRPQSEAESLSPTETLALALRVTMSLKSLGNAGAP